MLLLLFQQTYIQKIFLSYIDLLVNSNSSISLARVINIPDREIDHHAFTVLKRRANKSNLSMYQVGLKKLCIFENSVSKSL